MNISNIITLGMGFDFYKNQYDDLIKNAKSLRPGINKKLYPNTYLEDHHIVCKTLGGDNSRENRCLLTALEHIVAHVLLYLMYPNDPRIVQAAACMLGFKYSKSTKKNSRSYERYLGNLKLDEQVECMAKIREDVMLKHTGAPKKPVVCMSWDYKEVIKIYSGVLDVSEDGFCGKSIGPILSGKRKSHFGYRWMTLEDCETNYKSALEEYRNEIGTSGNIEAPIIDRNKSFKELYKDKSTVCFKLVEEIPEVFRVYRVVKDVSNDGICASGVRKIICRGLELTHTLCGYHFMRLDKFNKAFPGVIDSFVDSGNSLELTKRRKGKRDE